MWKLRSSKYFSHIYCSILLLSFSHPVATLGQCIHSPLQFQGREKIVTRPLMHGVGNSSMKITTSSKPARLYFNQGLSLLHGFWWNEALDAFIQAARLDNSCAMAYWGKYQVLSNALAFKQETVSMQRADALRKAKALAPFASERERDYINAIDLLESSGSASYLKAMEALASRYPDDLEAKLILILFILQDESMSVIPGKEPERWSQCRDTLYDLLKSHPQSAAVHHYWIHLVEGTKRPQDALSSARVLPRIAPKAPHLIHMPGHIFFRLGYYQQARISFLASMKLEREYSNLEEISPESSWNYLHNLSYLVVNCSEDGHYKEGLRWARIVGDPVAEALLSMRYGYWDAAIRACESVKSFHTLHSAAPSPELYRNGLLIYAKGMSALDKMLIQKAEEQVMLLAPIIDEYAQKQFKTDPGPYSELYEKILTIALLELRGSIESKKGNHLSAIEIFKAAIEREKEIIYLDPPQNFRSMKESLGYAYLRANNFESAQDVFKQEMLLRPQNVHAALGLARCFAMAGQKKEALKTYKSILRMWRSADRDLPQIIEARAWVK